MKKRKIVGIALGAILIGIVGFYSCEKTYVEPISPPTTTLEEPFTIIAPSGWRVTSFQWHDRSDNSHFISYVFQFNSDGSIMAVHNDIREYGKWSKQNNILDISFVTKPLNELNCNWTIIDHTATTLVLKGLSPYDNSSEYLELERVSATPPTESVL